MRSVYANTPKVDHPWKNSYKTSKPKEEKQDVAIPVHEFIGGIAENWENQEVLVTAFGKEGKHRLSTLPQNKQALWLAGLLRKIYV